MKFYCYNFSVSYIITLFTTGTFPRLHLGHSFSQGKGVNVKNVCWMCWRCLRTVEIPPLTLWKISL